MKENKKRRIENRKKRRNENNNLKEFHYLIDNVNKINNLEEEVIENNIQNIFSQFNICGK